MQPLFAISIILFVTSICLLFSIDHFKPINSLNIKYNSKDIIIPDKYTSLKNNKKSIKEKIISKLNSQPLHWENQLYTMPVYPNIGNKTYCNDNLDCNIVSKCTKDIFNRNNGIGVCTLKYPDKTVFDIKF